MERISIQMIKKRLDLLNSMVGIIKPVYYKTIGGYNIYSGYGKTGIEKTTSERGTSTVIIPLGTKRETFDRLCSFIDGLAIGIDLDN